MQTGRQRCTECGHPHAEDHCHLGCTVPKCACAQYVYIAKGRASARATAKGATWSDATPLEKRTSSGVQNAGWNVDPDNT